jgi:hypothetical protein
MKRGRIIFAFAVAAAILMSAGLTARQKPNFSGRWLIVSPPEGAGREQVVKQDDKTLSVGSGVPGGRQTTYQLDGAEHQTSMSLRGQAITILSKAVWDGNKLVLTNDTAYPNGMKTKSTEIWSIDDQGRLVVDFSETAEGQKPRTFKVIHTKKG